MLRVKNVTALFSWMFSLLICVLISCRNENDGEAVRVGEAMAEVKPGAVDSNSARDGRGVYPKLDRNDVQAFFPAQLGEYRLFNTDVSLLTSKAVAAATYIKGKDFNHSLVYTLEDGIRKGSEVLKNFETSYASAPDASGGAGYGKKDRDGHRTVSFSQPSADRNMIGFIYKNRFKLSMEGAEVPDRLWLYFRKEDLQKLDSL